MDLRSEKGLYKGATTNSIYYFYLDEKDSRIIKGLYLTVYENKEFRYRADEHLSQSDLGLPYWKMMRKCNDYHRLINIIFSKKLSEW